MTTIRPNPFPQAPLQVPPQVPPSAGPAPDAAKLAAQKAFFAMVSGQAPPAAVAPVAQPSAAAIPAPAQAPVLRGAAPGAEAPQKILRPGSLFDIRV